MNQIMYSIYKHKLKHMSILNAQYFCLNILQYQSNDLIFSLFHAVKETKPSLIVWYRDLIKCVI